MDEIFALIIFGSFGGWIIFWIVKAYKVIQKQKEIIRELRDVLYKYDRIEDLKSMKLDDRYYYIHSNWLRFYNWVYSEGYNIDNKEIKEVVEKFKKYVKIYFKYIIYGFAGGIIILVLWSLIAVLLKPYFV